jgi:hypothetical protein
MHGPASRRMRRLETAFSKRMRPPEPGLHCLL